MRETPNHREALGYWLNQSHLHASMAEVGCAQGIFAATVLEQWHGTRYHMIDPWAVQDKEVYRENQPESYDNWWNDCVDLARRDTRVNLLRKLSLEAAPTFMNAELDCVYIDGNHAYGAVMADLDAWWPKVRVGGLIGGHDYYTKTDGGAWVEVEPAVKRWAGEHNVSFTVSPCTSWWIRKTHA